MNAEFTNAALREIRRILRAADQGGPGASEEIPGFAEIDAAPLIEAGRIDHAAPPGKWQADSPDAPSGGVAGGTRASAERPNPVHSVGENNVSQSAFRVRGPSMATSLAWRYHAAMTYTITALSMTGEVEERHEAAEAALDAAMRLEAQGCRLIRIKSHDGKECTVTHLYRSIHGTGIDDLA